MSWQRVRAAFEELCPLPVAEREQRLTELSTTDRWLSEQLRQLFEQDAAASGFLERGGSAIGRRPEETVAAGLRLGRFELLRPLGTGGMGTVWAARQRDPERQVAIKLITRSAGSDAERWRFRHEVGLLARLNHPAIATFFEAGTDVLDGSEVAWFAMELVDGAVDVIAWAESHGLDRQDRLRLFRQLCAAVEYGHQRGVLHRDLKPGNVLVNSDGRLKLIDFGIARALTGETEADAARTLTGQIVGTIQYMAPEQIRGEVAAIGTASDVYALGVILYRLLCDRMPFDFAGASVAGIADIALSHEAMAPQRARPDLPRELGWILLRALEKDPARRYGAVAELVADLDRFDAHEPVRAGAPGLGYRMRKFVRRHVVAIGVGAVVVAAVGVGMLGLWHGIQEARAGERVAQRGNELSKEIALTLGGLFAGIDDNVDSREMKVHELLDRAPFAAGAQVDPVVESTVRAMRGDAYLRLGRDESAKAEFDLAIALQRRPDYPTDRQAVEHGILLQARLGRALVGTGQKEDGEREVRAALGRIEADGSPRVRFQVLLELCTVLRHLGVDAEVVERSQAAAELARQIGDVAGECNAYKLYADAAFALERFDDALRVADQARQRATAAWGADSIQATELLGSYVMLLQGAERLDEAARLYPELLAAARRAYGEKHPAVLLVLNNQAWLLMQQKRIDESIAAMREVVDLYEQSEDKGSRMHLIAVNNLGQALNQRGRFAEAEPHLRRAYELTRAVLDRRDPDGPVIRFNLGACLAWQKRWAEAEPILLAEYELLSGMLPEGHSWFGKLKRTIGDAYRTNGRREEGDKWWKR